MMSAPNIPFPSSLRPYCGSLSFEARNVFPSQGPFHFIFPDILDCPHLKIHLGLLFLEIGQGQHIAQRKQPPPKWERTSKPDRGCDQFLLHAF